MSSNTDKTATPAKKSDSSSKLEDSPDTKKLKKKEPKIKDGALDETGDKQKKKKKKSTEGGVESTTSADGQEKPKKKKKKPVEYDADGNPIKKEKTCSI